MKSAIEQLKLAEKDLGKSCRKCCSMANNCCCYFVSKSFQNAGNGSLFYNGVTVTYCPNAIKWCKTQLAQIPPYLALPSDIIFFDWNGNNIPDHIGMVRERKSCEEIYTLEGNTSGGIVDYKTRSTKYVLGIFRPHFQASFDISKPIAEDGYYGYSSVALTQKWLGVSVDGILGLGTVKALQKRLGVSQDGSWGNNTSKALQKLIGTTADGYFGENSVKALQRYLNKQVFKTTSTPSTTPVTKPQSPTKPSATPTASKYKVIDVSVWQGTIDWAKVKADGVVGAIIRYADGKTLDSKFDYNMKQAKANGLHIGAYIFSRAKTKAEAEAEATRLYNACKPYAPDLPLYIDLEASTLSKYADTVAQAFLNKMKALGGRGGVYANLTWWNKYLTKTAKNYSTSPFWIAQYNSRITHKTPSLFGMWQYSSSGKVKGISGNVDMDWLYTAYWEDAPKPTPTPTPTPTDELVVDGKGGTATVKALQRFLGKTQDGVISGQTKSLAKYYPSLEAVEFGKGGSVCVTFLQKWLGIDEDGVWGQGTSTALQTKLGVRADGIFGTNSMKALQEYLNEHDKAVYPEQTIIDKEMQACPIQADWMKNYIYDWNKWKPKNVAMSAKFGTCVTYVACVLQRIGILKSGQYIWHNGKGKVDGANSKMTVYYMSGSLRTNRAKLKRGDIVMAGDKSSVGAGGNSHIFILNGTWDSKGNPYIWDNQSASRVKKGKNGLHTYSGSKKIIAVVRLKGE